MDAMNPEMIPRWILDNAALAGTAEPPLGTVLVGVLVGASTIAGITLLLALFPVRSGVVRFFSVTSLLFAFAVLGLGVVPMGLVSVAPKDKTIAFASER